MEQSCILSEVFSQGVSLWCNLVDALEIQIFVCVEDQLPIFLRVATCVGSRPSANRAPCGPEHQPQEPWAERLW